MWENVFIRPHCEVVWGEIKVDWVVCECVSACAPRAILRTLMILMMVGFIGSAELSFSSSRVIPMMDRATIAMSSWFHLGTSIKKALNPDSGSLTKKKDSAGAELLFKHGTACRRISPVLEEPLDAKSHELEQGLHDEDAGKHVVAVLQDLF